jgi:hypothetical protein
MVQLAQQTQQRATIEPHRELKGRVSGDHICRRLSQGLEPLGVQVDADLAWNIEKERSFTQTLSYPDWRFLKGMKECNLYETAGR